MAIGALGLSTAASPVQAGITGAAGSTAASERAAPLIKVAQRSGRTYRGGFRGPRRTFRAPRNTSNPGWVGRRTYRPVRRAAPRIYRSPRRVVRRAYRPARRLAPRYAYNRRPAVRRYYGARKWRPGPRRRYWPRRPYVYYGVGALAGLSTGLYLADGWTCNDYYDYAMATGSAYWWQQYDICIGAY
ncbi:MAG: hypothetical protein C0605_13180 [Hyphomicrobiales bacterium]|nr:MAG: hypothetical protein C0605_13180 [Hyphomicrobiales bacterium]